jgi:heavy metal sensor kinase
MSLEERYASDKTPPYFAIWLQTGRILKASPPEVESTLTIPSRSLISKPTNEPQSRQRGLLREVYLLGPNASEILVGRSIERELADLSGLTFNLLASGGCVFVVGLGGGWWLSGRAVRPIQSMSATAATISVANLSQRIDTARIDDELGELGEILNAMLDRLENAFQQQVRFTADASHELRTPLTIILSHAELALSRQRTPEEYRGALEATLRSARRMKSLIEELLALARSDAGGLNTPRERVDLKCIVEEAAALVEPLAKGREVRLIVKTTPVEVAGDAIQLSQVVTNLLTNAVLYNRPSGEVTISTSQTDNAGEITVADTGLGIPQNDLPHVFERFYRVDKARSSERAGSGLGLAICQSIVEAHGGTIRVKSQVNVGSTFVVTLPLNQIKNDSNGRR